MRTGSQRSPIERTIVLGAVSAIVAVLACGDPEAVPPRLLLEDFEDTTDCGELPCGWEQIGGDDGQARYVETVHPGEHGILLLGAGVSVRGPGGEPHPVVLNQGTVEARVSARCQGGSSLILQAVVTTDGEGGAPATDTFEGRATPPEDWSGRDSSVVPMTASMALDPASPFGCGAAGGPGCPSQMLRVTALIISKTGSGECAIDRIVIDAVGFDEEPDTSC
jgi:hypothetical protein